MGQWVESRADEEVRNSLSDQRSFAMIAGAGSGKTSSLVKALEIIREREGAALRQQSQRIACITYTKRAVEVIKSRLGYDDLYLVSTVHGFLWRQISHFRHDIREALQQERLPALILKQKSNDNGGNGKVAKEARAKAERLQEQLDALATVEYFEYGDTQFSDYAKGQIGHDDVVQIAAYLFAHNQTFRRVTGLQFPYIFVDEAQDTFEGIVIGLNQVCAGPGLPLVGYFGDPWQQIYDISTGGFGPPEGGLTITKAENFRCSESVIRLLNAFRKDVEQFPAGENKGKEGSVIFRLVKSEKPTEPRNRYSEAQLERTLIQMDEAIAEWGWSDDNEVMRLFLVRQMIARRLGFSELNRLFNSEFASSRATDAFESGEHFLLTSFLATICPLVVAKEAGDERKIIDVMRRESPAFAIDGPNASNSLKSMVDISKALVDDLYARWISGTIGDILRFCLDKEIIRGSAKLIEHLNRSPRAEPYNEEVHVLDKGDWLADALFQMNTSQIMPYATFVEKNTAFSTQHGVKGEEYSKVMVVYDDVEASWHNYSFSKLLTPVTNGAPTDKQHERGRKLAYVSFSRAMEHLRVLLFTPDPEAAKQELVESNLLKSEQIEIAG